MTEQERKAKDAARKREAYARRKQALSPKPIFQSTPNPDQESAWKRVQPDAKIAPLSEKEAAEYVTNREKAEAAVSEAVAREEMVSLLFAKYEKTTNIPQLLAGILRELITLRVAVTDLIGGLRK